MSILNRTQAVNVSQRRWSFM